MEKKSKFKRYDVMECLDSERGIRLYLEGAYEEETEERWIRLAEDDARQACALYGFDPAAVGLPKEDAAWKPKTRTARAVREAVVA